MRLSDSADVRTQTSIVEHWGTYFGASKGLYDLQTSPVTVTLPGTVAQVGSSNSTEYALLTNGSLYAWGMGNEGQLGNGRRDNSFATPVQVRFPPRVKIWSIPTDAMPYDTGLAIDTTGRVWGWGDNFGGELCLGTTHSYLRPVRLPLFHVTSVAGASNHALYDANGNVYACGQNVDGDLGIGSWHGTTRPLRVARLDGSSVTRLVASFANSGALLANGRYLDWGFDSAGQLGDGRIGKASDVPVAVRLPAQVTQIAQGGSLWNNGQTLAMLSDGTMWGWGANLSCQLGSAPHAVPSPLRVRPYPAVRYVALATGSATAYAISASGAVYSWGVSHVGQVGNGTTHTQCTPVRVATGAAQISATADNVVVSIPGGK